MYYDTMVKVDGYKVSINKGAGTYRVQNPKTGEWKDYDFPNECKWTFREVKFLIHDKQPQLYEEDLGEVN